MSRQRERQPRAGYSLQPGHEGARVGEGRGHVPQPRRCAVYTRKSSEEGLEQDYNSLHAQREAGEAYIKSQQHEGWQLIPTAYDDGGLSGGSMERPALQRLLADIRAGLVDVIVVYKVDRLTRSLADFAKMVEIFDANGVSFVAVTQQFNTTSSMGRLTLNILLSFAQFEREVTGERIRDKFAASRRRGMWMGGVVPLGYDVKDRKLLINPAEAETVRHIYRRYLALGCVRRLKEELDRDGIVSKRRDGATGRLAGGMSIARGALYTLLGNPIYIGQVRHKGVCHPGQHEGILDPALWEVVQAKLRENNGADRGHRRQKVEASPLAGKLFDDTGDRLTPSHAVKNGRRYRYYVSQSLIRSGGKQNSNAAPMGWRLPAREIERVVVQAMGQIMNDRSALARDLLAAGIPDSELAAVLGDVAGDSASTVDAITAAGSDHATSLLDCLQRVDLGPSGIALNIALPIRADDPTKHVTIERSLPLKMKRRGEEMRMILENASTPSRSADPALLKAVARAHCWFEDLARGTVRSGKELAARLGITERYVARLLPLAFLGPHIVESIVNGQHAPELTAEMLTRSIEVADSWNVQEISC